jgi:hypothetical protein
MKFRIIPAMVLLAFAGVFLLEFVAFPLELMNFTHE